MQASFLSGKSKKSSRVNRTDMLQYSICNEIFANRSNSQSDDSLEMGIGFRAGKQSDSGRRGSLPKDSNVENILCNTGSGEDHSTEATTLEAVEEDYIMKIVACDPNVEIIVLFQEMDKIKKLTLKLDVSREKLQCNAYFFINSAGEFMAFMRNANNYRVSLHSRELVLRWKAVACQYSKQFETKLWMEECPLSLNDSFKLQIYFLSKKLDKAQAKAHEYESTYGKLVDTVTHEKIGSTKPQVKVEQSQEPNPHRSQFLWQYQQINAIKQKMHNINSTIEGTQNKIADISLIEIEKETFAVEAQSHRQHKDKKRKPIGKGNMEKGKNKKTNKHGGQRQVYTQPEKMKGRSKKRDNNDSSEQSQSKIKKNNKKSANNTPQNKQTVPLKSLHDFPDVDSFLYADVSYLSFIDSEGNMQLGFYTNERRQGKGVDIYANGQRYYGEFKHDCKEGYGKYYYLNGDRYEGEWKMDKCQGRGREVFRHRGWWEGNWENDEKHGEGIRLDGSRKWRELWDRGNMVSRTEIFGCES